MFIFAIINYNIFLLSPKTGHNTILIAIAISERI